jgi:hypothetical protein
VHEVVEEIRRVLRPGGIFAAVIPHPAPATREPDAALPVYMGLRGRALAEENLQPSKIGDIATKSEEGIKDLLSGFGETKFRELTVKYEMSLEEAVRYFSLLYSPGQLSAAGFERFKKDLRAAFSEMPEPILTHMPILCWSAVK